MIPHDANDLDRFYSKVDDDSDSLCWNWTAGKNQNGYGMFKLYGGTMMAHRAAWLMLEGEIPDGMELDHLCRNRSCVNPDHLQPVSHAENVRRGDGAVRYLKQSCVNGHEFTDQNAKYTPEGWRYCGDCKREQWTVQNEKAKARRQAAKVYA